MERVEIGRTGERVTAIGLGTWAIRDYRRAEETLVYAVERGIDNIDTAEMYGSGRAEELVGRVLSRVGRERVFVTTKLYPDRFRSPDTALKAASASLSRLGVDAVDLLLIHWPDNLAPIETQVRSLEAIADNGLARHVGVSNFTRGQLERALNAARKHEIVVDQVKYSPLDRLEVESELLPLCLERGVTIQAYTPLERGAVAADPIIRRIAEKHGKTPVQVALNYLISQPRVIAIPKTERRVRVDEFLGAQGWRLDEEDLRLIRESHPY